MENVNRRKIAIGVYIVFCIYVVFMWCISGLLNWPKSDMWLCVIGIIAGGFLTFKKKFQAESQAYLIGICGTVTIINYSEHISDFTGIFMILCVLTCLISFYHIPSINYIHLGSTTIYVVYKLFKEGWLQHIIEEQEYLIVVRIASIYLIEITMLIMVKWHLKALRTAAEKTRLAEHASQAKDDFLANVSHEIRTPLNVINGMTELVMQKNLDDEAKEYVYGIHRAGDNLLTVINDILDYSKLEAGELELADDTYETMSLFYDICSIAKIQLEDKPVEFQMDINPAFPVSLKGDVVRLKQIILNLISNAIKYTEQGEIIFKADFEKTDTGIDLKISVKDSGIGIKEEDIQQLFHAFEQLDSKRSRSYNGIGLGLTISKQIVSLMGGELKLESTYGKGSHFYFTIPQVVDDGEPSVEVKGKEDIRLGIFVEKEGTRKSVTNTARQLNIAYKEITDKKSLAEELKNGINCLFLECEKSTDALEILEQLPKNMTILMQEEDCLSEYEKYRIESVKSPIYSMSLAVVLNHEKTGREMYEQEIIANRRKFLAPEAKILIVDDNAVNLKVAVGLLRPYGMQTDTAISGEESVQKVLDNKYDLVLMDHMMPGMDGIEATKMIRQQEGEYYKKLPIIALSANAVQGAQKMFKEAGMDDFVPKPIEMRFLAGKLIKWLPEEKLMQEQEDDEEPEIPEESSVEEIEEVVSEPEETKEEQPSSLSGIEGLDMEIGLSYVANDEELYHDVLRDYADEVEMRADEIEMFLVEDDMTNYVIHVHALKSLSKTIGAMELFELAKELEDSGNAQNMEVIQEKTPILLKTYRELGRNLQAYIGQKNGDDSTKNDSLEENQQIPLDKQKLEEQLMILINCLDEYDSFGAEEVLEEIKKYRYESGTEREMLDKMMRAMQEFDYHSCKEAAYQMKDMCFSV